ncbi:penicillin-binding protein [Ligilactobacillus equi]|uniref:transglycosylase domain-containing protein n=1 Tax=Ligilactobacillus equi TaxID=137357 RepID=UPI002ED12138
MSEQEPKYSRTSRRQAQENVRRSRRKPSKGGELWKKIIAIVFALFVLGFVILGTVFFVYAKSAPTLNVDKLNSSSETTIYDSQGNKIISLGAEKRQTISANQMPSELKDAVTSIEDKRFYKHNGVDPYRIVAATLANITHASAGLQGGSTLDQQLIKLSYFSTKRSDQTLKRKAQEAWLALQLDRQYSKDEILNFYVNKVYMGNGIYGMETAAKYYYGKSLKKLNLAQTALIAGIPNAPSSYNPYASIEYATSRRNDVLLAMYNNEEISKSEYQAAKAQSVKEGLIPQAEQEDTHRSKRAIWADAYLKQVIKDASDKGYDPYSGNLQIYTNVDMDAQEKLYKLANSELIGYPDDNLQVAATVVNPNNGKIVAMIGGRNNSDTTYGLNRAVQTNRSTASTAKPLVDYGPAIQYLSWATYHKLSDTAYNYPGTSVAVNDFDHAYKGDMSMQQALIESRNIPAVKTLEKVGIDKSTQFLSKLGFNIKNLHYSNAIGLDASSLQNAAAYAAFANGGTYYQPTYINKIVTANGDVKEYASEGVRAMDRSTAFMITAMLKKVITSSNGTGNLAAISGLYQAGKTGTNGYPSDSKVYVPSNSIMDGWFNGYTKNYSISVWTGYDQPYKHFMSDSVARSIPLYLYRDMMTYLSRGVTNSDWTRPSNVYPKRIDGDTYYYLAGSEDPDIISSKIKSVSSVLSSISASSESSQSSESSSSEESSSESSSTTEPSSSAESSASESSQTSTSTTSQPSSASPQPSAPADVPANN